MEVINILYMHELHNKVASNEFEIKPLRHLLVSYISRILLMFSLANPSIFRPRFCIDLVNISAPRQSNANLDTNIPMAQYLQQYLRIILLKGRKTNRISNNYELLVASIQPMKTP